MLKRCLAFLLLVSLPSLFLSTTGHDLRSRIRTDGRTTDFSSDEWILDPFTILPYAACEARW